MFVYLDVILLENFVVDYFILVMTSQILRVKLNIKYGILASVFASAYCIVLVVPNMSFFSLFPFELLVSLITVLIAFRKNNIDFNIKAAFIYILVTMLLAGICTFFKYSFIKFNYKILILSISASYILIYRLIIYIKDRKELIQLIYSVDIVFGKNKKGVRAFLDTGNELREPATNLPVIIVDKSIFDKVDLSKYEKLYIPYKGINGENGMLNGFMPEYVVLKTVRGKENRKAIIAFSEGSLSILNDYEALLSRGII